MITFCLLSKQKKTMCVSATIFEVSVGKEVEAKKQRDKNNFPIQ